MHGNIDSKLSVSNPTEAVEEATHLILRILNMQQILMNMQKEMITLMRTQAGVLKGK